MVIPAAGASRRLGLAKQLLELSGKPLLLRAIELAESIRPIEVIVVTGADGDEIQSSIECKINARPTTNTPDIPLKFVENPNWCAGIGSSIATGISALAKSAQGAMILLSDQWKIQPADLQMLHAAWLDNQEALVTSYSQNYVGPPVVFPKDCFAALSALSGDNGARSVIAANMDRVQKVRIDNAIADLDTPNDLRAMRSSAT